MITGHKAQAADHIYITDRAQADHLPTTGRPHAVSADHLQSSTYYRLLIVVDFLVFLGTPWKTFLRRTLLLSSHMSFIIPSYSFLSLVASLTTVSFSFVLSLLISSIFLIISSYISSFSLFFVNLHMTRCFAVSSSPQKKHFLLRNP